MKIIGIIPARYRSTRFPGKPLVDICGKPMIWWVYQEFIKVDGIDSVYVATDDERIVDACNLYGMKTIMTSEDCPTHLERLYEVSTKIDADFYINVNGDEPLIDRKCIADLIPDESVDSNESYVANGMMILNNPIDAYDTSKIKVVTDVNGYGMYISREPLPFPKARSDFHVKKFVGVQCFTKKALKFVHDTPREYLESIEDIDEFRFLEHGHKIKFILTEANTLAVDTPKDVDKVRSMIAENVLGGGDK